MAELEIFDVFLCHNSLDKDRVRKLAKELRQRGLKPWLDTEQLQPGLDWQPLIEHQIKTTCAAAVIVGSNGLGPWMQEEMYGFLRAYVKRKVPVIPTLLETCPSPPELPVFLEGKTWVDFRTRPAEAMTKLIWGITGQRPPYEEEAPVPAAQPAGVAHAAEPALASLLRGAWSMAAASATGAVTRLEFFENGTFAGSAGGAQLTKPTLEGTWSVTANQLSLKGRRIAQNQAVPYSLTVTIDRKAPYLSGVSELGERLVFRPLNSKT